MNGDPGPIDCWLQMLCDDGRPEVHDDDVEYDDADGGTPRCDAADDDDDDD